MFYKLFILCFLFQASIFCIQAQNKYRELMGKELSMDKIPIHDPVMIKQNGTYYVFGTGYGIEVRSSKDLKKWRLEDGVFKNPPQWALDSISGFDGTPWAPDICYYKDKYYLFYSVSSFGKNTSAIGVATNSTLNPKDPGFKWVDHGMVIQSKEGENNWNAIDPNIVFSKDSVPYMAFGSFWGGLKIVRLTDDLLAVDEDINTIPTIASRNFDPKLNKPNSIEGPFIYRKGDYFYLFASINLCCRGMNSTYEVIVGRSKSLLGPYIDKEGKSLLEGGGDVIIKGNKKYVAGGHNGMYKDGDKDIIVFHAYDRSLDGAPRMVVQTLKWNKGWPVVKGF